ncbi:MAG: conjugal transfer protein TraG N-terminal domain-containing protein [Rickettsia endosymbiont of Pentastiridius leporinus]
MLGLCIIVNGLLLPSTHMIIKDHISKDTAKVDHIPLAFAVPVGILEEFGYIITRGFEQAFRPFSNQKFDYFNYGLLFGQRLKQEVKNVRIKDPVNVNNMRQFVKRCVVLPAMIGNRFTKEELFATDNIWKLVKDNAGGLRRVELFEPQSRQYESMTCKEAAAYLERHLFPQEEERILVKFANRTFNQANDSGTYFNYDGKGHLKNPDLEASLYMKHYFKNNIKKAYGVQSAENLLKHQMMINAISSFKSGSYAVARARMQHESSSLIGSDMASIYLPLMLVVFKCIVYGAFIFVVPMILMSGGFAKYMTYLVIIVSLQLWPALNAILNMIMETYSDFAEGSRQVMSYAAVSTMYKKTDTIVTIAASLQMLVPFLSFWLTKLGGDGIMHLAGNIVGGVQSVSGSVGSEVATNNKSFDNYSSGNQQYGNTSSNKVDTSMQYFDGTNRGQYADGTGELITQSGEQVFSGGSGQTSSTGEARYVAGEGIIASHEAGIRKEQQLMSGEQASLSTVQEQLVAQEASALHSIMQNTKTDTGYNIDTSTDYGKELQKTLQEIDKLDSSNNYGWQQNARAYMQAEASLGTPSGMFGGFFSAKLTTGGDITAVNNSEQSDSQARSLSEENATHAKQGTSERTNNTESFLESLGVDKNTQDSLRESYQQAERLENSISAHKNNIDSHHQGISHTRNNSANFDKDMYQDVLNAYQNRYGGTAIDAQREVAAGTYKARAIFRDISGAAAQRNLQEIQGAGSNIASSNNIDNFVQNHQLENNIGSKRDEFARDHGIRTDAEVISGEITTKGDNIKAQHATRYNDNLGQYADSHQHISDQQYAKQLQINQYEEDRIGKGGFSQKVMDGVGRPSSHNLNSPNKKQYEPKEQQVVAQYTDPHKPFDKDAAQALMDAVSKNKD